ncbi:MAG TPA: CpaF family protein, partial [Clostridia bacterium]|nr:CpaF family protein [Clostridia bacterium]
MVQVFNPLDYAALASGGVEEIKISLAERLPPLIKRVRAYLRDQHRETFARSVIDPRTREMLKKVIHDYLIQLDDLRLPQREKGDLIRVIQQEILYFGPIQKALDDPQVTNIDINTPFDVFIERNGEEEFRPDMAFRDEVHLENIINKMLIPIGRSLTANEPHVDSLFDNYRICAVLGVKHGGIATESTCVSIRKFSEETIAPDDLVRLGTMSAQMDAFFRDVLPRANCIIAGATNSGKTTTLISLPLYFEKNTRLITIEDSPEMMLRRKKAFREYRNIVSLQTKDHENPEKRYDIAK